MRLTITSDLVLASRSLWPWTCLSARVQFLSQRTAFSTATLELTLLTQPGTASLPPLLRGTTYSAACRHLLLIRNMYTTGLTSVHVQGSLIQPLGPPPKTQAAQTALASRSQPESSPTSVLLPTPLMQCLPTETTPHRVGECPSGTDCRTYPGAGLNLLVLFVKKSHTKIVRPEQVQL